MMLETRLDQSTNQSLKHPPPPPPAKFKPAVDLTWVYLSAEAPAFAKRMPRTGRRAMGVRYERRMHEHFIGQFGERYIPSPWFRFGQAEGSYPRWCQPDALLFDFWEGRIIIIEAKYQHTSDAWWQLTHLYYPVLRKAFRANWSIALVEVVKWFDPEIPFPVKPAMLQDIRFASTKGLGVHIWKP